MKASTTWLSADEIGAIVETAVGVLAETGMRFTGSQVLPLLAERGAEVDEATGLARLPRELVAWALARCPRSVLMAGATPADDVLLDEGEPFHFVPSGCVAKTLDYRTGVRRASTLQDFLECTSLLDELPELDLMATQVSAGDVPIERREAALAGLEVVQVHDVGSVAEVGAPPAEVHRRLAGAVVDHEARRRRLAGLLDERSRHMHEAVPVLRAAALEQHLLSLLVQDDHADVGEDPERRVVDAPLLLVGEEAHPAGADLFAAVCHGHSWAGVEGRATGRPGPS